MTNAEQALPLFRQYTPVKIRNRFGLSEIGCIELYPIPFPNNRRERYRQYHIPFAKALVACFSRHVTGRSTIKQRCHATHKFSFLPYRFLFLENDMKAIFVQSEKARNKNIYHRFVGKIS